MTYGPDTKPAMASLQTSGPKFRCSKRPWLLPVLLCGLRKDGVVFVSREQMIELENVFREYNRFEGDMLTRVFEGSFIDGIALIGNVEDRYDHFKKNIQKIFKSNEGSPDPQSSIGIHLTPLPSQETLEEFDESLRSRNQRSE